MSQEQMKAAKDAMINSLGKYPVMIACIDEFDLYNEHYYIFKYKEKITGSWMLGVAGGYTGDSLENSGQTFGGLIRYTDVEKARKDAIDLLVGTMNPVSSGTEFSSTGVFNHLVLLSEPMFDGESFIKCFKEEWNMENDSINEAERIEKVRNRGFLTFSVDGATVFIALLANPMAYNRAMALAQNNYRWQDAQIAAEKHKAQLLVKVVRRDDKPAYEAGKLMVKVISTLCQVTKPLGVYANAAILEPAYCIAGAELLKKEPAPIPIMNLVWYGVYKAQNGFGYYTSGLRELGYEEIEILDKTDDPDEILNVLIQLSLAVVVTGQGLLDREDLGLNITKSEGVAVDGESLKIS